MVYEALIIGTFAATFSTATGFLLASLGEAVAERSGVMNLGIEGIMLMGAFMGFWGTWLTSNPLIGIILAMGIGAFFALIHAIISVSIRANQMIVGFTIWLALSGLSGFLYSELVLKKEQFPRVSPFATGIPILEDIEFLGLGKILFSHNILVYSAFLLVPILIFVLYRTSIGLKIRAVGENPKAADAVGVNVIRTRYIAVIFGGIMAGIAGFYLSVVFTGTFQPLMTSGRGWIAIVIVVFGRWDPKKILAAALIFGGVDAIQLRLQGFGFFPGAILTMLPYIISILALLFLSKRQVSPSALTIPYSRTE